MKMRLSLILVAAAALFTGCTNVKPWERGTLADATMNPNPDPLGAGFLEHTFFSREAATCGRGISGGGCGFN